MVKKIKNEINLLNGYIAKKGNCNIEKLFVDRPRIIEYIGKKKCISRWR